MRIFFRNSIFSQPLHFRNDGRQPPYQPFIRILMNPREIPCNPVGIGQKTAAIHQHALMKRHHFHQAERGNDFRKEYGPAIGCRFSEVLRKAIQECIGTNGNRTSQNCFADQPQRLNAVRQFNSRSDPVPGLEGNSGPSGEILDEFPFAGDGRQSLVDPCRGFRFGQEPAGPVSCLKENLCGQGRADGNSVCLQEKTLPGFRRHGTGNILHRIHSNKWPKTTERRSGMCDCREGNHVPGPPFVGRGL